MRQTQGSEQPEHQMEPNKINSENNMENYSSSTITHVAPNSYNFDSKSAVYIKKEKEMDFEMVPESVHLAVKNIKVENDSDPEDKPNISNGNHSITIPGVNHISVGEIKIEDGICNKVNFASKEDNAIQMADDDDRKTSPKIIYEKDSDDDMMSLGEENTTYIVSKWKDEHDLPTTSRKISNEENFSVKKENKRMKIKEETISESDSDMDILSDDDEEFLSDVSGGEVFLSDGDENSTDNQNLNIDNKAVVTQLIDEYHKRPQLWFGELPTEMSDSMKLQLFRSINNDLSKKCNVKFNANRIKMLLKLLCTQYEAEIERQLKENEEATAESSNLWFYDKLFFIKDDIENKVKLKLENTLEVLDDNILADLIDIYKSYDNLWDTNNTSFPDKKQRHVTMQSMCLEIKNKLKISLNTFKLEYQLFNLHKKFKEYKQNRFTCERRKQEYKSSLSFINKCDFLENHQAPFKCHECTKVLLTYQKFRQHKAEHDGTPPFTCNICGKVCKNNDTLDYHGYLHNGVNYSCSICGKHFCHPQKFRKHIKNMHILLPVEYSCSICGNKYLHSQTLKEHKINVHILSSEGKIFKCNICGKGFDRSNKVKRHKKLMHEEEPIQCKICGKICKNPLFFQIHNYRHSGKNYNCRICGKIFIHPSALQRHMTMVHSFNCKNCGEVCCNTEILKQHAASLKGKLNCEICGKNSEFKWQLKPDKYIHEHEFQCKICGKFCKNGSTLKYHSLTHSGKKYDCSICGASFAQPPRLKQHMRIHDKKFECAYCRNKFASNYSLQRHENLCKNRDNLKNMDQQF